jgi:hypothetical protein
MEGKKLIAIKIAHCLRLIEQKVNLGDAAYWKQRDFETVGNLIEESTGVLLSAATIKRLFQHKQESVPQTATLVALAQFAGYPSFQAVPAGQEKVVPTQDQSFEETPPPQPAGHRRFPVGVILISVIIVALLSLLFVKQFSTTHKITAARAFSHKISNDGVPSTVLFSFDVPRSASDSLWLQPTYDTTKRIFLPPGIKQYHHVYYHPSYHRAKLILNGHEIAETGVHIKTTGWLGVLYRGSEIQRPYYLPFFDADSGKQVLGVAQTDSDGQKLLNAEDPYRIRYYNIADFGGISGDSLFTTFETFLERSPGSPCVRGFISLLGHNGRLFVSLDEAGCTGESRVSIGEHNIYGKYTDLTGLGLRQNQWQPVSITAAHEKIRIAVGERNIEFDYTEKLGPLMGIVFEFIGKGKVRNFEISALAPTF